MAVLGKWLETEFDRHRLVHFSSLIFFGTRTSYFWSSYGALVRIESGISILRNKDSNAKYFKALWTISDKNCPGASVELCFKMSFHYRFWILWNMFLWMVLYYQGFVRSWPSTDHRTLISPWSTDERIKACWYEEKKDGNRAVSRTYTFCESSFCQRKWWYLWKYSTCQMNKI